MPAKLTNLNETAQRQLRDKLLELRAKEPRPWETLPPGRGGARPKQLPPDHPGHCLPWTNPRDGVTYRCSDSNPICTKPSPDWTIWIILAGRGFGKTMTGAQWCLSMAMSEPNIVVGVIAPSYSAVQKTCFDDLTAGIVALALPGEITDYNRNNLLITMRNGSKIQGFTAEQEKSIRGANLSYAWFDEAAFMPYQKFFDYALMPALRVSPKNNPPRLLITTTPTMSTKIIRKLIKQAETEPERIHVTRAYTLENIALDDTAVENLYRNYRGTYLERQELKGELMEEVDAALFKMEDFNEYRIEPGTEPDFRRVVVAIDPATTSGEASDETGIIVAAEGTDNHFYTLADLSLKASPSICMQTVADAYWAYNADYVVGEKNAVGDYMKEALAKVDPTIFFKPVYGMKGKVVRAVSVSMRAAQGQIHMIGGEFETLEDQLVAMTPYDDRSQARDDRADAWVWAMIELTGQNAGSYKAAYGYTDCQKCGENVNIQLHKKCGHCGEPVPERTPPAGRDRATRWSSAYQKICINGHEYSLSQRTCPRCAADPNVYLAQAMGFGNGDAQRWFSYVATDWFAGRRI